MHVQPIPNDAESASASLKIVSNATINTNGIGLHMLYALTGDYSNCINSQPCLQMTARALYLISRCVQEQMSSADGIYFFVLSYKWDDEFKKFALMLCVAMVPEDQKN